MKDKEDVIIFSRAGDDSTDNIIEWLSFYKLTPKRINAFCAFDIINYINCPPKLIFIRKIDLVLFKNALVSNENNQFYMEEQIEIVKSIFQNSFNSKIIGWPNLAEIPRIIALIKAKKIGLNIPRYEIIKSKMKLKEFKNKNNRIIIRPLRDIKLVHNNTVKVALYVKEFYENDFKKIPEFFAPILGMQLLDKKLDVRVIYLDGKLFSTALIPLNIEDRRIDSRIDITNNRFRFTPIQLPKIIEDKLTCLIKNFKLLYCTIDLILNKDGKYYFLDINAAGQYHAINKICNYNIDKLFSKIILKYAKK